FFAVRRSGYHHAPTISPADGPDAAGRRYWRKAQGMGVSVGDFLWTTTTSPLENNEKSSCAKVFF
ncbi:MAG: hypothetical protein ACKOB6_00240, partial [Candidatus Kapaibacterium sp.]